MAHVLIIEDDSMIAAIERDFLEANGFEVSVAMTGKEGLKIFDGGAIEAVLLDIGLPDTETAGHQQRPHPFHHRSGERR